MRVDFKSPFIATGRSVRNCLRLEIKPSETTRLGVPKSGKAEAGTGIAGVLAAEPLGLVSSGGRRSMIGPGTVSPQLLDAATLRSVSHADMIHGGWQRLCTTHAADTNWHSL